MNDSGEAFIFINFQKKLIGLIKELKHTDKSVNISIEDFTESYLMKEVPIEKILSYDYWNKLQQFLQGYDRSFSLCKSQCGKIVSSREKTEEDLKTGEITLFNASNQIDN